MITKLRSEEELVHENEELRRKVAELEKDTALLGAQCRETGEVLRRAEERLALITGSSPDLVFQQDAGYRYVWVSKKRWLEIPEDMIGKTDLEVMDSEEDARRNMAIKGNVMESGRGVRVELPGTMAGKLRYYDTVFEPWRDPEGKIIGITGYVRDITERKKIEQRLRDSKAKLEGVFNASPNSITVSDLSGRITDTNPATYRMFGYARDEIIGKSSLELLAEKDRARAEENLRKTLHRGCTVQVEYDFLKKDGHTFPGDISAALVRDSGGRAIALMAITRDITAQKRAAEALKESERRLATLLSNLPGMAYRCRNDRNWTMLFVSQGAEELTGCRPADLTGNKVSYGSLIHPDDRDRVWNDIQLCLSRRQSYQFTYRIITAGGEEKWVWEQGRGLFAPGGDLQVLEGFIADISERKRAEDALRASEEKFRLLFTNMLTAVALHRIVADDKGVPVNSVFLEVNDAFMEMTGLDRDRVLNRTMTEAIPGIEKDTFRWIEEFGQVALTGKVLRFEQYSEALGRWYSMQAYSPKEGYFVTVFEDITGRKHGEEALRDREETLSSIFRSSQIGIGVVSYPERVFLDINDRICDITGYAREELIGRNSRLLYADEAAYAQVRTAIYEKRGSGVLETRWRRKDGTVIYVLLSAAPIDPDNLARGVAFSFLDITDRKRAQEQLQESNERLQRTINGIINTIVKIVETRDPYTAGHQKRVAQLAVAIAREMGLPEDRVNGLRIAAVIHDIGKIYIPAEILSKPGALSGVEKEIVNLHPKAGYDILSMIEFPWPVAEIALQHQERYNGSGYPSHKAGKDILPEARILTVADVVEAMTFHRPYRPAIGIDKALAEIKKNSGVLYDPQVAEACLRLFAEHRFSFREE